MKATQLGSRGRPPPRDKPPDRPAEPEALVASYWFDSGDRGPPYGATVRFTGRRHGVGNPKPRDSFVKDETIEGVVPGTGPVSITTWVYGLQPGEWMVNAELIGTSGGDGGSSSRSRPGPRRPVLPAAWSWLRWRISTAHAGFTKTRWAPLAPLARQPAVLPGVYAVLVAFGSVAGLAIYALMLADAGINVGAPLTVALLAVTCGLVAARLWYAILHPGEALVPGGWAVDGMLIVTPLVGVLAAFAVDLPIGTVIDAAAPGLFLALAIARVGCFFTGCCSGRPTGSRWGIWSSDRRVGARRIPTQLMESAASLLIGTVALALVLASISPVRGTVFVAGFVAYAMVRQAVLRLRAERRRSPRTIPLTAGAAALVPGVIIVLSNIQRA